MGRIEGPTIVLIAHCLVLIGVSIAVYGAGTAMCEVGRCPAAEYVGVAGALFAAIVFIDIIWAVLAWTEVRKVRDPLARRALSVGMVLVPMLAWYVAVVRWNTHRGR